MAKKSSPSIIIKKKPKSLIPFKCPHHNFSCPYIDSVNMKATKSCKDCENKIIN